MLYVIISFYLAIRQSLCPKATVSDFNSLLYCHLERCKDHTHQQGLMCHPLDHLLLLSYPNYFPRQFHIHIKNMTSTMVTYFMLIMQCQ